MHDDVPVYTLSPPSSLSSGHLTPLSDHLLLHCLSFLTSWDLCGGVRLSCRRLSHTATALLRTRHLEAYQRLIRAPYTSQPLGQRHSGSPNTEGQALDRFAIACSLTTRLSDESDLHLLVERARDVDADRPSWIDDIFGRWQPTLRLTDLLVDRMGGEEEVGVRLGLKDAAITLPRASSSSRGMVRKEVVVVKRDGIESLETLAETMALSYRMTTEVATPSLPALPSQRVRSLVAPALDSADHGMRSLLRPRRRGVPFRGSLAVSKINSTKFDCIASTLYSFTSTHCRLSHPPSYPDEHNSVARKPHEQPAKDSQG